MFTHLDKLTNNLKNAQHSPHYFIIASEKIATPAEAARFFETVSAYIKDGWQLQGSAQPMVDQTDGHCVLLQTIRR